MDYVANDLNHLLVIVWVSKTLFGIEATFIETIRENIWIIIDIITYLGPVVQRVNNAIQRINRYPVVQCLKNKLRYPLDSDLFIG